MQRRDSQISSRSHEILVAAVVTDPTAQIAGRPAFISSSGSSSRQSTDLVVSSPDSSVGPVAPNEQFRLPPPISPKRQPQTGNSHDNVPLATVSREPLSNWQYLPPSTPARHVRSQRNPENNTTGKIVELKGKIDNLPIQSRSEQRESLAKIVKQFSELRKLTAPDKSVIPLIDAFCQKLPNLVTSRATQYDAQLAGISAAGKIFQTLSKENQIYMLNALADTINAGGLSNNAHYWDTEAYRAKGLDPIQGVAGKERSAGVRKKFENVKESVKDALAHPREAISNVWKQVKKHPGKTAIALAGLGVALYVGIHIIPAIVVGGLVAGAVYTGVWAAGKLLSTKHNKPINVAAGMLDKMGDHILKRERDRPNVKQTTTIKGTLDIALDTMARGNQGSATIAGLYRKWKNEDAGRYVAAERVRAAEAARAARTARTARTAANWDGLSELLQTV